jgi:7,8-dihydroneopterin aldolase/epimerase/oxygenase
MSVERIPTGRFPAPSVAADGAGHYRMFIRDLVLEARIGVYPHERKAPQRVRFNIDMRVREHPGPLDDDLAKVLSYDTVIAGVRRLLAAGHINLVETLAESVAQICLADSRVTSVKVAVEKLDIEAAASGVGVEIERRRS